MKNYYSKNLSAERLHLCYKISSDRIKQYQEEEIRTVLDRTNPNDFVLDLGCGYGRVFKHLLKKTQNIYGVDISFDNLYYARNEYLESASHNLIQMNAVKLGFLSDTFDLVFCIQNGISAFKEEPKALITESIRVTKPGGRVLFSSYSSKIWAARLEWFQAQAEYGLLGEIDYNLTGNGVIICKDGFKATTFNASDFEQLTQIFDKEVKIYEVDNSSIFCEIIV